MHQNEWISVKDRLPENQSRVFVFSIKDNALYDSWYIENHFLYLMPCNCLKKRKEFKTHITMDWPSVIRNATHWMPLPEPPKE